MNNANILLFLQETLSACIGTIAFALLFGVPRRYYPLCGMIGAVGWVLFRAAEPFAGRMMAVFLASAAVVLLSRLFAVRAGCPATIFMVPGLFPLVPGAGIYWTIYELVMKNMTEALSRGFVALQDAVAIVLGIVVIFELPQRVFARARKKII